MTTPPKMTAKEAVARARQNGRKPWWVFWRAPSALESLAAVLGDDHDLADYVRAAPLVLRPDKVASINEMYRELRECVWDFGKIGALSAMITVQVRIPIELADVIDRAMLSTAPKPSI